MHRMATINRFAVAEIMRARGVKVSTLANEIEQLRADMMRRCDELGVKLTELEEGGNG